jgi:hypothetical protein
MRICRNERILFRRHSALNAESNVFFMSPASMKISQFRELLPVIFSCPKPTLKTSLHHADQINIIADFVVKKMQMQN